MDRNRQGVNTIERAAVWALLAAAFTLGSAYHFQILRRCRHLAHWTKLKTVVSMLVPVSFLSVAFVGGNRWYYYLLSLLGAVFLLSGVAAEGFDEQGIYYRRPGSASVLVNLARWGDIHNIQIDWQSNRLRSFTHKKSRIYVNQQYSSEAVAEIKRYTQNLA